MPSDYASWYEAGSAGPKEPVGNRKHSRGKSNRIPCSRHVDQPDSTMCFSSLGFRSSGIYIFSYRGGFRRSIIYCFLGMLVEIRIFHFTCIELSNDLSKVFECFKRFQYFQDFENIESYLEEYRIVSKLRNERLRLHSHSILSSGWKISANTGNFYNNKCKEHIKRATFRTRDLLSCTRSTTSKKFFGRFKFTEAREKKNRRLMAEGTTS